MSQYLLLGRFSAFPMTGQPRGPGGYRERLRKSTIAVRPAKETRAATSKALKLISRNMTVRDGYVESFRRSVGYLHHVGFGGAEGRPGVLSAIR